MIIFKMNVYFVLLVIIQKKPPAVWQKSGGLDADKIVTTALLIKDHLIRLSVKIFYFRNDIRLNIKSKVRK